MLAMVDAQFDKLTEIKHSHNECVTQKRITELMRKRTLELKLQVDNLVKTCEHQKATGNVTQVTPEILTEIVTPNGQPTPMRNFNYFS